MSEEENDEKKKKEVQSLIKGFIELKAKKEAEKTALNIINVDVQWRDLMREVKSEEFQRDLYQMKQSFVKAVDYKDAIIAVLQAQLEQSDVQNMWTICNNMKSMEELISMEHRRSQNLFQIYEEDLEKLKKKYEATKQLVKKNYKEDTTWFKDLNYIEEVIFQNLSEKSRNEFTLMNEDINVAVEKEKSLILESFDTRILDAWKRFQSTLVKYLEDANAMEKMFDDLKEEYQETVLDAEQDIAANEELKKVVPVLKADIDRRKEEYLQRLEKSALLQDEFYGDMNLVKEKIHKLRKNDKLALTELVKNSTYAIKELKRMVAKGDKIMKLYQRMKKLEQQLGLDIGEDDIKLFTEEETKLFTIDGNFLNSKNKQCYLPENLDMDKSCTYILQMEKLWERYNKAILNNLAIKKELSELDTYSKHLQNNLKNFMKNMGEPSMQLEPSKQIMFGREPTTTQEAVFVVRNKEKCGPQDNKVVINTCKCGSQN